MPKNDELWVLSGIFKEIDNMRLVYNYIDVIMTLIRACSIRETQRAFSSFEHINVKQDGAASPYGTTPRDALAINIAGVRLYAAKRLMGYVLISL